MEDIRVESARHRLMRPMLRSRIGQTSLETSKVEYLRKEDLKILLERAELRGQRVRDACRVMILQHVQ
ncbi:hypothetical protein M569_15815 [Genlisea aurea]|uniref:Uncharacterized protein n=1 Tax=Genlisea aurea TaxID=192259 RepID=S8DHX9_9LAMI|nr:hypothetical protein M569_15815 [Genlisea aurea]